MANIPDDAMTPEVAPGSAPASGTPVSDTPANGAHANGHANGHAADHAIATQVARTVEMNSRLHYLNNGYGWKSWLFTLDHKRIGLLYLFALTFAFLIGGAAAGMIRVNLIDPRGLLGAEMYNKTFTAHGVVMVFLFLVPSIPASLGNFFIPMMIGAKDVAFPKLNLLSWYLYMIGAILLIGTLASGGVATGWTFYAPLSSTHSNGPVVLAITGVFIAGFSSILTGLNFIVTIHKMRAPGLTWFRLPLFIWSHYATSLIQVLGTPVLAITLLLLLVEHVFHIGVFDPQLGGDPVLFQHLFWFYSHPAVYIMVLPGMAVISEIITCFSRKQIFGYKFIAFSSLAIAIFGFLVWGHHLFVSSQSPYAGMAFSVISFMVAIPSAVKVFNWSATLYKGSIRLTTPMLYALGFIGLFTIGGLTGLHLAAQATDVYLHDTYFVIAHFHYIMVGGTLSAYLGGIHYWWPKMTGRMYPEAWGKTAAVILFVGFNLTFFPQFLVGMAGMNRRYVSYAPEFQFYNIMSSAGASVLALGFLLPLFYLVWSLKHGEIAGPNPWGGTGLEWQTPSPPPTTNFERTPVVTTGPYMYSAVESERAAQQADDLAEEVRRRVLTEESERRVEEKEREVV